MPLVISWTAVCRVVAVLHAEQGSLPLDPVVAHDALLRRRAEASQSSRVAAPASDLRR